VTSSHTGETVVVVDGESETIPHTTGDLRVKNRRNDEVLFTDVSVPRVPPEYRQSGGPTTCGGLCLRSVVFRLQL